MDCYGSVTPRPGRIDDIRPPPRPIKHDGDSRQLEEDDDEEGNTSIYIYIGVGVGVGGIVVAVLVVVIVYCVLKRKQLEKQLESSTGHVGVGYSNKGFVPPGSEMSSRGGRTQTGHTAVANENSRSRSQSNHDSDSVYDYIDDTRFNTGTAYSKLKDEHKYSHDYKYLPTKLDGNLSKLQVSDLSDEKEYIEPESIFSSGGIDTSNTRRLSESNDYVDTPTRVTSPSVGSADEYIYSTASQERDVTHRRRTISDMPTSGGDEDETCEYIDPSTDSVPRTESVVHTKSGHTESVVHTKSGHPGVARLASEPPDEQAPAVPYHSYLEVLAPAASPLRGQGRSSLPPLPTSSVADSLGPQPPLPRRNDTFHYYSQPGDQ